MTAFTLTVPGGSDLSFTDTDGAQLERPVVGLVSRTIDLLQH